MKRNKAVYINEYERNGIAWVRIQYKDYGTEVVMTKEEWMKQGNR